ncbi:MAG: tRNA pseudouridine(55) synthase TruB [Chitinispirillaceae bacterium]|nr:tRNA pseudouridine(55) synthase TruB [Chitinispirillaceae bacterium]
MNRADGFLCIDKPCGQSSFDVVENVRRVLGYAKAGHSGTLDPAASGLLFIALGRATRLLPFCALEPKRYRFRIQFGQETDTLDSQGAVVKSGGVVPQRAALEAALTGFTGTISQRPPAFSAVKIGGRRAYRLAREGTPVDLPERTVAVGSLTLAEYCQAAGQALLDVTCSGGTYVRSLARDIAAVLGTCGFALSIRRLAIGRFTVENALAPEQLDRAKQAILPVRAMFADRQQIIPDEIQTRRIMTGSSVTVDAGSSDPLLFAFDNEDHLLAVLERRENGMFHPVRVFLPERQGEMLPVRKVRS